MKFCEMRFINSIYFLDLVCGRSRERYGSCDERNVATVWQRREDALVMMTSLYSDLTHVNLR